MTTTPVRVGQVWADNDPRAEGRTVKITALYTIDGVEYATVKVLTNRDYDQARIDAAAREGHTNAGGRYITNVGWVPQDTRGKTRRIKVRRLRPTSSGYRLVKDVEA